jgi:hypothetical protein
MAIDKEVDGHEFDITNRWQVWLLRVPGAWIA